MDNKFINKIKYEPNTITVSDCTGTYSIKTSPGMSYKDIKSMFYSLHGIDVVQDGFEWKTALQFLQEQIFGISNN